MKSLLFQIGFLLALVAPFLVPYLVMELYFGLKQPWPPLAGFVGLGLGFFAFAKWNKRELERELAVTEKLTDAVLGAVTCRRDSWEATIALEGTDALLVSGITARPTEEQRQTVLAVLQRITSLLDAAAEAARDVLGADGRDVVASDLVLESILVDEADIGTFSMTFEVPRFDQMLPWGLSVDFVDYRVECAEAIH